MTTLSTKPRGQATLLSGSTRPGRPDRDLISRLRVVYSNGIEAMAAVELYDPNLPIKMSNCATLDEVELLLDAWSDKRANILAQIKFELHRVWTETQANPGERP